MILHLRIVSTRFLNFDHRLVLRIKHKPTDKTKKICNRKYKYFVPNSYQFLNFPVPQLLFLSMTLDLSKYLVSVIVRRLNIMSDFH
jgi:hypothetical protein